MPQITVLQPADRSIPTKTFKVENNKLIVESYPKILCWGHTTIDPPHIGDYHEAYDLLQGYIFIRGTPDNPQDKSRRSTNFPDKGCEWLTIDVDNYDNTCNENGVREYIKTELPDEFQNVACSVQFSASAGIYWNGEPLKPGLNCHITFFLDRQLTNPEVKQLLKNRKVDMALYTPVQPHYVTDPIIEDSIDLRLEQRTLFMDGDDVVQVPAIEIPPRGPNKKISTRISDREPTLRQLLKCNFVHHFLNEGVPDGDGRYAATRAFCHNIALVQRGSEIIEEVLSGYENADAIRRSIERFPHPICCKTFLSDIAFECAKFNGECCSTGATAPIAIARWLK
ncbi:MAG: hypothetical protein ACI845_002188 [Gammaproteobacteria bacterium]|jgi:hypothetical protein